jgi:hypothetical protein
MAGARPAVAQQLLQEERGTEGAGELRDDKAAGLVALPEDVARHPGALAYRLGGDREHVLPRRQLAAGGGSTLAPGPASWGA